MDLYLFALLPLALLSLFERGRHRATAGLGFLAALAPVVAKGLGSLIGGKQKKSEEKQREEYARQKAEADAAADRARFEADQNSPAAAMQRMKYNMQLGRLLGAMGGREKVPPSLLKSYDAARAVQQYVPGAAYVGTPKKGGTGWDIAAGVADALGYLDTDQFKKPGGKPMGQTPDFNPMASSAPAPVASGGGASPLADLTARLRQPQPITLSSGNTIKPFDPKLGPR